MVLLNALCALNLASSVMINGAFCCYQMEEEKRSRKEEHEAIKSAIRAEVDRHRELDAKERRAAQRGEARRRSLMERKQAAEAAAMVPPRVEVDAPPLIPIMTNDEDDDASTQGGRTRTLPHNFRHARYVHENKYNSMMAQTSNEAPSRPRWAAGGNHQHYNHFSQPYSVSPSTRKDLEKSPIMLLSGSTVHIERNGSGKDSTVSLFDESDDEGNYDFQDVSLE